MEQLWSTGDYKHLQKGIRWKFCLSLEDLGLLHREILFFWTQGLKLVVLVNLIIRLYKRQIKWWVNGTNQSFPAITQEMWNKGGEQVRRRLHHITSVINVLLGLTTLTWLNGYIIAFLKSAGQHGCAITSNRFRNTNINLSVGERGDRETWFIGIRVSLEQLLSFINHPSKSNVVRI